MYYVDAVPTYNPRGENSSRGLHEERNMKQKRCTCNINANCEEIMCRSVNFL